MKLLYATAMLTLFTATVCAAETCADKIASIETEIKHAEENNNSGRLRGLNKALRETKENCDDKELAQNNAEKILDREQDVIDAQRDLDRAIAKGESAAKIKKKRLKLEEQKIELEAEKF